jgi:hypothetical protein
MDDAGQQVAAARIGAQGMSLGAGTQRLARGRQAGDRLECRIDR